MRIILSCLTAMVLCGVSQAAVTLQGSTEAFTGPGVYNFDITIEAVGQTETILGFTLPFQNLNGATPLGEFPDVSLSDLAFTPNPLLELPLASSDFTLGGFGFSVSAQDNNGSPLVLNPGESAVLLTIPMTVLVPGDVLAQNVALAALQTITTTTGSTPVLEFGSASVAAIPEPSSLGLVALGAAAGAFRRRRR